jgi:hypothetical protein
MQRHGRVHQGQPGGWPQRGFSPRPSTMWAMNPFKKLASWLRGPAMDPEAAAEGRRLREDRDLIRISQTGMPGSTPGAPPAVVPPTPDVLHPGREDSHSHR